MKLSDVGTWSLEFITPEMAAEYLTRNGPNRPIKVGRVAEYARAQLCGDWKLTHQGIAFDMHGLLTDGQHRLAAIVKATLAQWVMVFRWKVPTDISVLDDGKARTIIDAAAVSGVHLGTKHPAVVKIIADILSQKCSGRDGRLTRGDSIRMIESHKEAIDWVEDRLGHEKGIGAAIVVACIAMAWYTEDRERLEDFIGILKKGVCSRDSDSAAIKVRDYVINPKNICGGRPQRLASFRKIQAGLKAFLEHRVISRLHEMDGVAFPIPCATPPSTL
jgi:hypothetical protein